METTQYTNRSSAPLAWHSFTRFVRAPLGIAMSVFNSLYLLKFGKNDLIVCFILMELISAILLILFFVGSINWKRYAWQAIVIFCFYNVFLSFCSCAIFSGKLLNTIVITLGIATMSILEYKYYKKRELLFDNERTNIRNNETVEMASTYNDGNILFCRKCGAKVEPDAMFCRKCGTRIGG